MPRISIRVCLVGLLLAALLMPAWAQKRVALVIGNAAYVGQKPLRNPGNDAQDMAAALQRVGFKAVPLLNLGRTEMNSAVDRFLNEAEGADLAVVYYSGHGMQVGGESFLIPVDARINSERDVRSEALRLGELMDDLEARRIRHTLLILDACRDNPFRSRAKGAGKGLARPKEMNGAFMVAYATADGFTADDGDGRNGIYTAELLKQLRQPGKNLRDVLEDTQLAVETSSKGEQRPKTYGDTVKFRNLYFASAAPVLPVPPAPTPSPLPAPVPVVAACSYCPEMVVIPAGRFVMGSPASEPERSADEGEQRTVSVASFEMGKYEVTQGQWEAVMGRNPSHFSACGDDCPVEKVSWEDVQAYIRKLNEMTGRRYRLPSEAEWEYSARAGTTTPFHTGPTISPSQANFDGNFTYNGSAKGEYRQQTTRIGSFAANAWGLHDMHGNVREWVQDVWHGASRSKGSAEPARARRGGCMLRMSGG